ncbi:MAG: ABC transporter permease [Bifidobacteriaceae bacterium]|jgi:ABC-2 type transport system permease protein|nr:ABC transporter permease [Bifidobacteriaceae bacterium]
MTALTAAPVGQQYRSTLGHELTLGGIIKSEWIKARSLRSTWWCGALMVALSVGFAALLVPAVIGSFDATFDLPLTDDGYAISMANSGLYMVGQVIAVVFGALTATSEYSSGSIRSTLAAAPRRGPVLIAKAIVVALVMAVVSTIALIGSTAVAAAAITANGYSLAFGADAVKMAVGVVFFLVVTGWVGLGLGFALRSSAGAIASGLGLYLILPNVLFFGASREWVANIIQLLPTEAGQLASSLASTIDSADPLLGGWTGAMICLAVWAAAALTAGYLVFKKRDA